MLEERRNGRSGGSAELQQTRAKLNETRDKFKELVVCALEFSSNVFKFYADVDGL